MIIYPAYMYASLCAYLRNIHNTHLCIILDIFVCVCIYAYRKSEMRLKLFQRKPHYMKRGLPSSSRSTHSLTPSLLLFQCGQQLPYIAPRRPWRARWTGGQQACQCREPGPGGLRCHGRQRWHCKYRLVVVLGSGVKESGRTVVICIYRFKFICV